ncbi:MAG: hypothetical protein GOV00_00910 [Candidatus Altiarchaeota archaeon]|nr:hypothetical protein [Candidatus Altiarchaeota archaeon]
MNRIVCDASSIITLSSNCLLWLLKRFENIEFVIPPYVKKESVDVPLKGKRHGFDAMRNGNSIGNGLTILESDAALRDNLLNLSNSVFVSKNRSFKIVHRGEIDMIAVAKKHQINTLLVDEKNTRLLIEDRVRLKNLMERRTHRKIEINKEVEERLAKELDGLFVLRSSELVAEAVKRNIIDWPYSKRQLLRNALYALKFKGCAITEGEIVELVNVVAPVKGE